MKERDGMLSSNGDGWTSSVVGAAWGVGKFEGTVGGRCRPEVALLAPVAVIGRAAAPVARPNVAGAPVAVVGRGAVWALLGVGGALWLNDEPRIGCAGLWDGCDCDVCGRACRFALANI